jgi:cytoskeletal protein CcmA (bactofilin family)
VVIAEEGVVHADAKAKELTIGGSFEGQVEADKALIVLSTGNCSGNVTCRDLVVEAGGVLNADVTCQTVKPSKPS